MLHELRWNLGEGEKWVELQDLYTRMAWHRLTQADVDFELSQGKGRIGDKQPYFETLVDGEQCWVSAIPRRNGNGHAIETISDASSDFSADSDGQWGDPSSWKN